MPGSAPGRRLHEGDRVAVGEGRLEPPAVAGQHAVHRERGPLAEPVEVLRLVAEALPGEAHHVRHGPHVLELEALSGEYAICRLPADAALPDWARPEPPEGDFVSISRTRHELSITCPVKRVPPDVRAERDWACFKVVGPLDFGEIGVVASLAAPLAEAGVSIFVVSTFDTDYLLVKSAKRNQAVAALAAAGHRIATSEP